METIMNIVNSLAKMNEWKITRLDIQYNFISDDYRARVFIDGERTIDISEDGTIDFVK